MMVTETSKKVMVVDYNKIHNVRVLTEGKFPGGVFDSEHCYVVVDLDLEPVSDNAWVFGWRDGDSYLGYKKDNAPGDIIAGVVVSTGRRYID